MGTIVFLMVSCSSWFVNIAFAWIILIRVRGSSITVRLVIRDSICTGGFMDYVAKGSVRSIMR